LALGCRAFEVAEAVDSGHVVSRTSWPQEHGAETARLREGRDCPPQRGQKGKARVHRKGKM
jgi:hypothetical protein